MTQPKTNKPADAKPGPPPKMEAKFPEANDKPNADAMAKFALRPSVNAALVMDDYTKPLGKLDLGAVVEELADGIEKMNAGDMSRAEGMLYAQAHALQAIFMNFSRRALHQNYQKNLEGFMRMALKAQNQCRMTLETLATLKNPPVVFANQANINNGGQQQVNNGVAAQSPPTPDAARPEAVGSVQSLPAPAIDTARIPTHGTSSPLELRPASQATAAKPPRTRAQR